eukprot:771892-Pyramimonas_sp.AAC.1
MGQTPVAVTVVESSAPCEPLARVVRARGWRAPVARVCLSLSLAALRGAMAAQDRRGVLGSGLASQRGAWEG